MGPRTNESVANVLYQPLCYYTAAGKFVPILATAFDPAADHSYMDITLRKGVKFHDGSDFNAKALKWNMDRYMVKRPSAKPQWKSIDILDDYKVRVNLNFWTNTIYSGLGGQLIGSPKGYTEKGEEWGNANPAGTGPFKFKEYQRDVKLTLVRFDDYWEKGKPYLDGLVNIYLGDLMTTQMAFEANDLDLVYLFLGKQATEIKAEGFAYNQLSSALCPVHALVPSNANPASPLSNLKVRQAISYAFDRKTICDALGYGWLAPIHQMAPLDSIAYSPELEKAEPDSIDKAKQLLKEAGYPNGFKTRLIMPPQWANQELASALQAYLAKIGVQAAIEFPASGKFTEYRWTTGGWDDGLIFQEFINWAVYTMHPSFYYYRAGATPQFFTNKYPEGFDALVDKLLTTTDIEKNLAQQYNKMLFDDKTAICLYQLSMAAFFQPWLHTNFMAFSFKTDWLPADAWMGKKPK
jgi:ABC-type transport system substrate-binding protein